jgi:hypothetical protein
VVGERAARTAAAPALVGTTSVAGAVVGAVWGGGPVARRSPGVGTLAGGAVGALVGGVIGSGVGRAIGSKIKGWLF